MPRLLPWPPRRRCSAPDAAARRTLAVIGDPADGDSRAAALAAAEDTIETGELVVLTTSPDFTGFFAGLHAEHPDIAVTVLRMPDTGDSLRLARPYAAAEVAPSVSWCSPQAKATFSNLRWRSCRGSAGAARSRAVPTMSCSSAAVRGERDWRWLRCSPAAALRGGHRPPPGGADDSELVAGLEQLRAAGARVGYEVIDISNPVSLAAAVQRIEGRLGPTAIGHAASTEGVPL